MTEFESEIKKIPYSDEMVFGVLSDLSKLESLKDKLPEDKIQDFWCTPNSCSFSVAPVGKVTFDVVDREPNKTIKFKSQGLPFEVNAWIQLVSKSKNDTRMKLTLRAQLNPFIKPMVSKPMKEGIDKISEVIASLAFDEL
ncbi:MAG TPA: SRPBCC family protein [Bacteroidales bacterium]|nr:SRPBCC family protein [Bacteroidales bacterium]